MKAKVFLAAFVAATLASCADAGSVRVTDSVNAGARPARIPRGAEPFKVERPRAHGGAVVRAEAFGFSEANDLNAAAVMRAFASQITGNVPGLTVSGNEITQIPR